MPSQSFPTPFSHKKTRLILPLLLTGFIAFLTMPSHAEPPPTQETSPSVDDAPLDQSLPFSLQVGITPLIVLNWAHLAVDYGFGERFLLRLEIDAIGSALGDDALTYGPSAAWLFDKSYDKDGSFDAFELNAGVDVNQLIPTGFFGYRYHGDSWGVFRAGVAFPFGIEVTYGFYL